MSIYNLAGNTANSAFNLAGESRAAAFKLNGDAIPLDAFLDNAVVTALPSISVSGIKQGACTDGTYIYQICFDNNNYTSGKFIKYKISDGTYTTITFDGTVNFGHGNDMCYNPNNGHIYVCCMTSDGAVIELDSSLQYVQTHYVIGKTGNTYKVWQFCFDRNKNHFLSANGSGMAVYDQNWNYIGWYAIPTHPNATAQGCETDGNYIYRITYDPNYIDVATIDGSYVKTINLPVSGEPEAIMFNWTNGEYYISRTGASNFFFKVELFE